MHETMHPGALRDLARLILALLLLACGAAADSRPNILLIITDDQRADSLEIAMPFTAEAIFRDGSSFDRAYATTPVCCPSRSSIFTGMYAGSHGVRLNTDELSQPTFMQALHRSGYFTGLVGKYLNTWNGRPRQEFDFWRSVPYGSADYRDPSMNVDGLETVRPGYATYLMRDDALEFVRLASSREQPFLLVFAPNAPHSPAEPAPEDAELFADLPRHRPPSFRGGAHSGKPRWLRARPALPRERMAKLDTFRLDQLRTLRSLDRSIQALAEELRRLGAWERTAVFFISDNGFFWGEHGLESKDCVYEEAIRVPFAARIPGGRRGPSDEIVANIDIAPTIYDLTGVAQPPGTDGISLAELLREGAALGRQELLIEGWKQSLSREPFKAVHTSRYVYVENFSGDTELYDLQADPYQIRNLAIDPASDELESELKDRLTALLEAHQISDWDGRRPARERDPTPAARPGDRLEPASSTPLLAASTAAPAGQNPASAAGTAAVQASPAAGARSKSSTCKALPTPFTSLTVPAGPSPMPAEATEPPGTAGTQTPEDTAPQADLEDRIDASGIGAKPPADWLGEPGADTLEPAVQESSPRDSRSGTRARSRAETALAKPVPPARGIWERVCDLFGWIVDAAVSAIGWVYDLIAYLLG